MPRRFAALLLTVALAVAGLTIGPCPDGRCAMRQAAAHDCCRHDGLTRPSCCEGAAQVSQQTAPPALERPAEGIAMAAAQPLPVVVAAVTAALPALPRVIDPGAAPPGTLIRQHTSLLL